MISHGLKNVPASGKQLGRAVGIRSASNLSGDDYQFLHKSSIPTYHFQKSLRRLPIPKLTDTCNRYLASAKVVIPDADYQRMEKLVREFEKNEGPQLQAELRKYDRAHKETSYISEPWFDMYLRSRVPCPVNYNPFMMYASDPDSKYNHQLTRATNFAISYGRFKRSLDSRVLAPEVFHLNPKKSDTPLFRTVCKTLPESLSWFGAVAFKAFPLDMSQYRSVFNGNRIPKREKDVLYHDDNAKHFLAVYRGRFYAIRLFNDNGKTSSPFLRVVAGDLLEPSVVHASLAAVMADGRPEKPDEAVGALTSLPRDEWADARVQLENEGNMEALRDIDGALFAICLDELNTQDPKRLVKSLLIGDEARNLDSSGQATINFEHSWGDGVAVLRLMEESFADTNKNHFVSPDNKPGSPAPGHFREIQFRLSDGIRQKIVGAQKKHVEATKNLDFATVEYPALNRDNIKKYKLSPDSVMQLAIQVAFYSVYKEFVPTYESCSTAAFLKGRTECMRSATAATRAATLALADGKTGASLRPLFDECSKMHGQLVKEASMGQGFDRHLLGLRITANRLGKPLPAVFQDPTYARMGHFILSTSTLSTETIVFGGFGPVVEDGFGIGYNVVASKLGAVISSYKDKRNASEFANAVMKSLDQIKGVLDAAK